MEQPTFTADGQRYGPNKTVTVTSIYAHKRHKWWDINLPGTTLEESGKWSTDATARIYYSEAE